MTDLFDSRAVPLHVQIEAVEREVTFRIRVYGRRVNEGKMTQAKSDHETAAMRAVLTTLQELRDREASEPDAVAVEREACAKVMDDMADEWGSVPYEPLRQFDPLQIAKLYRNAADRIRSRSQP